MTIRELLHKWTAPKSDPTSLPFCAKCHGNLKRGQKHTVVSFIHENCPEEKQ